MELVQPNCSDANVAFYGLPTQTLINISAYNRGKFIELEVQDEHSYVSTRLHI